MRYMGYNVAHTIWRFKSCLLMPLFVLGLMSI